MADQDAPRAQYPTPARYRLLATSYLNGEVIMVRDGEPPVFVDYDGHPGSALEPTDSLGAQRKATYLAAKRAPEAELTRRRLMLIAGEGDPFGAIAIPSAAVSAPARPVRRRKPAS